MSILLFFRGPFHRRLVRQRRGDRPFMRHYTTVYLPLQVGNNYGSEVVHHVLNRIRQVFSVLYALVNVLVFGELVKTVRTRRDVNLSPDNGTFLPSMLPEPRSFLS